MHLLLVFTCQQVLSALNDIAAQTAKSTKFTAEAHADIYAAHMDVLNTIKTTKPSAYHLMMSTIFKSVW